MTAPRSLVRVGVMAKITCSKSAIICILLLAFPVFHPGQLRAQQKDPALDLYYLATGAYNRKLYPAARGGFREFLQKHGNIDEDEMLRVFNMGIGYTLIVRPHFADAVAEKLTKAGETVYTLGKIAAGSGNVVFTK